MYFTELLKVLITLQRGWKGSNQCNVLFLFSFFFFVFFIYVFKKSSELLEQNKVILTCIAFLVFISSPVWAWPDGTQLHGSKSTHCPQAGMTSVLSSLFQFLRMFKTARSALSAGCCKYGLPFSRWWLLGGNKPKASVTSLFLFPL